MQVNPSPTKTVLNQLDHANIPVSIVNPQKYIKPPISSNAKRTQSKTIKAALKLANKTSVVKKTQTSANPMLRYSSVPITSSVSHSEYDLKYNTTRLEIEKSTSFLIFMSYVSITFHYTMVHFGHIFCL